VAQRARSLVSLARLGEGWELAVVPARALGQEAFVSGSEVESQGLVLGEQQASQRLAVLASYGLGAVACRV
jgi:hypothetical protein